jgi:hypothetical protein
MLGAMSPKGSAWYALAAANFDAAKSGLLASIVLSDIQAVAFRGASLVACSKSRIAFAKAVSASR